MNLEDYSKEELIVALYKMKKEYPACYRSFVVFNLNPAKYDQMLRDLYESQKD